MNAVHQWVSRWPLPILRTALAVVTLQCLTSCKPRSENIPGGTSRVQAGAPRLDAATRRQGLTDVAPTIRDHSLGGHAPGQPGAGPVRLRHGCATLVGERTAGMTSPWRTSSIGKDFELTVPFLLFRYGR